MKEMGKSTRTLLRALAALAGAGVFLFAYPVAGPVLEGLLGRATLLSAAFAMPEGALATIRQRYAPELGEESPPPGFLSDWREKQPGPSASSQPPDEPEEPDREAEQSSPAWRSPPDIPAEYRAPLLSATMTGEWNNTAFCRYQWGWVQNYTRLSLMDIDEVLETRAQVSLDPDEEGPQVLIYHTHATESYEEWDSDVYDTRNKWRSQDNTANMAAVGEVLAQELEKRGIGVIHDVTQHDHPAYNGAYDRSAATIRGYLDEYPTIRVAIDVHRDAVLYDDGSTLKVVQEVGGRKAAQLMVIAPCDDGTVGVPDWEENFRFAAGFTSAVEKKYPGLMRPVFFCYRNYNLWMTPDSLLFEFGTNGNTLEEAKYTARLVGPILADFLLGGARE